MLMHAAQGAAAPICRDDDFVARIGGDEFVVLCHGQTSGDDHAGARWPTASSTQMHQPVPYEGHECRFGVSIGIASERGAVVDPRRLLINADIALYRAKSRGRNRYEFFTEALQAEIVNTKRIADDILSGSSATNSSPTTSRSSTPHTLDIVGVEALARWNHPTEGLLAPDAFLKIAEELNVVGTIDRHHPRADAGELRRAGTPAGLDVPQASVNVSARRLHDEELISEPAQARHQARHDLVRTGRIDLPRRERRASSPGTSTRSRNSASTSRSTISAPATPRSSACSSSSRAGSRSTASWSSRSSSSPAQRQLVGSIIDIGKSLGIEVLAEGVETMAHAKVLKDLGCHALQGYAFARAMSADDLKDFVLARKLRAAS